MTGYVLRIERRAVGGGPGVRTTVFLKGCPLRCDWCHSPESQRLEPELMFREDRCIRCFECVDDCKLGAISDRGGEPVVSEACRWCGDCADGCPTDARLQAGSVMTESRLLQEIERDTGLYRHSGGGVTFSGGEPLMQPDFLVRMLDACKAKRIHTAVETSGAASAFDMDRVADRADLIRFDVKHLADAAHRRGTGSSNRQILDNLKRLAARGANVRVRVPLISGFNDDVDYVRLLGQFLASLGLSQVDVVPCGRAAGGRGVIQGRAEPPDGSRALPVHVANDAVRILTGCGLDAALDGR